MKQYGVLEASLRLKWYRLENPSRYFRRDGS